MLTILKGNIDIRLLIFKHTPQHARLSVLDKLSFFFQRLFAHGSHFLWKFNLDCDIQV